MLHGKEIELFFGKYGILGILGIILSSSIMGIIIYIVLKIAKKYNICKYNQLLQRIISNKQASQTIKIGMNIFLLISFYIMIAGFSAYFTQQYGFPIWIGSIVCALFCYITFMGNINRIIQVNTILIPVLIISIVLLSIKDGCILSVKEYSYSNIFYCIRDALLYASYNSIILIPILLSIQTQIKTKKQIKIVSICCTIILIILAICILNLIWKIDINIR